ncbi:DUF4337 domain-containing protein [Terrarubrum flagellatum]|uniref:DUF4337 domain-containing protein n=1 Tax=Terrirubrum flagellatum TaxID=2895980 RepID=UPI0031453ED8
MSGGHGGAVDGANKKVALLIAVLALLLAFSEAGGKNAQNDMLSSNIEASNLWAFFQAKTIRITTLQTAIDQLELDRDASSDASRKDAMGKRVETWKAAVTRYNSEPDTQEGRKELSARAKKAEEQRDRSHARDTKFEIASGILQVGIVLASASIITGIGWLVALAGGLGVVAFAMMSLAVFAPLALFH